PPAPPAPLFPYTTLFRSLRGKASLVVLGENALAVDSDVEDAAAAADDLRLDAELFLDLSRQTGGSREVVSNAAVINSYLHSWQRSEEHTSELQSLAYLVC